MSTDTSSKWGWIGSIAGAVASIVGSIVAAVSGRSKSPPEPDPEPIIKDPFQEADDRIDREREAKTPPG